MSLNLTSNSLTMNGIAGVDSLNVDDIFVSGIATIANSTTNNDNSVGGSQSNGGNFLLGGNIVVSGLTLVQNITASSLSVVNDCSIGGNINYQNKMRGFIYVSNKSIPLIHSLPDITVAHGNLNIQTVLGTTGNLTAIFLLPYVKIQFISIDNILLYEYNNNTGYSIYNIITFKVYDSLPLCETINLFYNDKILEIFVY